MSIFGNERIRLLREKWGSRVDPFAEELFAILGSDTPLQIDGPIQINNNTTDPAITINQAGNSDTSIQINTRSQPGVTPINVPPITIPGVGGITITIINNNGDVSSGAGDGGDPNNPPTPAKKSTGGGGGIPGKVISGGPGDSYTVRIYPDGLSAASSDVTVTQLSIDSEATIPADTWTIVTKIGDLYYMQVPVWGPDL